MKVSIIIPVIRPEKAERCMDAIRANAGVSESDYEIIHLPDVDGIGCPKMVAELTGLAKHEWVMFLGDDTIPEPGFLKEAIDAVGSLPGYGYRQIRNENGSGLANCFPCDPWGVVGLNTQDDKAEDGINDKAHWMAHKKMLDLIPGGFFFSPEYKHCYCDDELQDIAIENDRWVFAEKARVLHDHPINGGDVDEGYLKAYSDNALADRRIYQKRKVDRKKENGCFLLAICWPVTNLITYADFAISYAALEKPRHLFLYPEQIHGQDIGECAKGLDQIRNSLVDRALLAGCSHILMMDTDQCYRTPDMIRRLLSHGQKVVGARVHRRYPPFDPLLFRWNEDVSKYSPIDFDEAVQAIESGSLVEVDATGAGCVMYDSTIFFDVEPPWFEFGLRDGRPVGEDIVFCEKLRSAGHRIYVDTSIDITHLTIRGVGMGDYVLHHHVAQRR